MDKHRNDLPTINVVLMALGGRFPDGWVEVHITLRILENR
jgi:hypothetical protein